MRVYHLISEEWGLDDIRKRRLKISKIDELNDPFELLGVSLSKPELRSAFLTEKAKISREYGIICFSRGWRNPVLWSHYADSHKGLCLGFDVPDKIIRSITYSQKRIKINEECVSNKFEIKEIMDQALYLKFAHWRYENEVRTIQKLKDLKIDNANYFLEFGNSLQLRKVIIGAESKLDKKTLLDALGDLKNTVKITKARCAFRRFRVVTQQNKSLWYN